MLTSVRRCIAQCGLIFCVAIAPAQALTYKPRMDQALWIARSHVLSCKLIQPIPFFGRAVFDHSAGRDLRFYLESVANPFEQGQAAVFSRAPSWHPGLPEMDMGAVNVKGGNFPVQLEQKFATQLLAELYKGKSPAFLRKAWYVEEEPIEVALSSATFRDAYSAYRQCLGDLSPVGFEKLQRSRVLFDSDQYILTQSARDWLDIVANYLINADDVERLFIDGHTDNTHTTTYNIELSRNRSAAVSKYLVAKGVSPNQITQRFHGERYPIKSNATVPGRQANRRVTLRVQLVGEVLAQR